MVRKAENLRLKAIRKRKIAARHARTRAQSNTKAQCVVAVLVARTSQELTQIATAAGDGVLLRAQG